jgi:hypothetical protein
MQELSIVVVIVDVLFVVFVECLVVKKNWEKDFNFPGDSVPQGPPPPAQG